MGIQVEIVEIGTYVGKVAEDSPKVYVVTQTATYQEEGTGFVTKCTIWEVSDEGDIIGESPETVKSDEIAEI